MGLPKNLLGDDEELVMVIRPHKRVLIGPVLILVLIVLIAVLFWSLVPADLAIAGILQWVIIGFVVIGGFQWVLWPVIEWWNTVYAITTHRLVTRAGVFSRSGHDMPLTRLNDVSFSHTLFQRLLGCGTLVAESAGERGQLVLRDIPDVEKVQRTLYELANDAHQGEWGASLDDDEDFERARRDQARRDKERREENRRRESPQSKAMREEFSRRTAGIEPRPVEGTASDAASGTASGAASGTASGAGAEAPSEPRGDAPSAAPADPSPPAGPESAPAPD